MARILTSPDTAAEYGISNIEELKLRSVLGYFETNDLFWPEFQIRNALIEYVIAFRRRANKDFQSAAYKAVVKKARNLFTLAGCEPWDVGYGGLSEPFHKALEDAGFSLDQMSYFLLDLKRLANHGLKSQREVRILGDRLLVIWQKCRPSSPVTNSTKEHTFGAFFELVLQGLPQDVAKPSLKNVLEQMAKEAGENPEITP